MDSLSALFQKREITGRWTVCLLSSRREKSQGDGESVYSLPESLNHREKESLTTLF
jgi:hypothetical protein